MNTKLFILISQGKLEEIKSLTTTALDMHLFITQSSENMEDIAKDLHDSTELEEQSPKKEAS